MRNWILFMLCWLPVCVLGQNGNSPYHLSWNTDALLFGGGATLLITDFVLSSGIEPLTTVDIDALSVNDINSFDRSATENFSVSAATRSDIGFVAGTGMGLAAPFLVPVLQKERYTQWYGREFTTLGFMWLETNFWNLGVTNIAKATFLRTRPFVYNPDAPMDIKLEVDARKAFFSGHTSITAANTFFAAKVYHDYFPESKMRPYVWAAAALIPLWTGIERYNAGKHFPTDVITGYAWGAFYGWIVPQLHKRKEKATGAHWQLSPYAGFASSGMNLSLRF